ncbi:terminase small subunit [Chromobacterium subtsugae]|uniref:terminase small subunit n=1 Tax=Chromobacterium subtsugae TaxID=251747 RepID=UPI0007F9127D|nr:terminase small subunit [Chromobacterium subtsugae]
MAKLTPKQQLFVQEYLIDLNATAAAARAKYSDPNIGRQLITKHNVITAIAEAQQARSQRTEITADMVLDRLWQIATADPNDLVQYRRDNCRHCWGAGHQYQWTEAEFEQAQREAKEKGEEAPGEKGGFGYVPTRDPNPACPECAGEGRGKIFVSDTRRVKGSARLLYAGVKQGRDGLELKMHDQLAALNKVAEHIGLFRDAAAMRRAEEMHKAELAAKQAVTDKIRHDLGDGGDEKPTPVQIVVEVKDARKRSDDA